MSHQSPRPVSSDSTALALCEPGWEIRHLLPGRVRLQSLAIRGNPALARGIEENLSRMPGVHRAEVNPSSGSVLVLYQAGSQSIEALVARAQKSKPAPRSKKKDENSWPARVARGLKHLAHATDCVIRQATGDRLELRQIVLTFLFVRVGVIAAEAGAVSWSTIQGAIIFVVAWTLYEHPEAEQQVKEAKDVASPAP